MSIPNFSIKKLPTIQGFEVIRLIQNERLKTTNKLLEAANSPKKRKLLSLKVNISEERLLELANYCSLLRIKHLGPVYVELLRACGVHTVVELSLRNSDRLSKKIREKNEELKLSSVNPLEEKVKAWQIAASQQIQQGRIISYN